MANGAISEDVARVQEVFGDIGWSKGYFNSGVMVFARSHASMLQQARERVERWTAAPERQFQDQTLLNYVARRFGTPLHDLGFRFNHTPAFSQRGNRFDSHFIHYAGLRGHRRGHRIRQMYLDRWILRRPAILSMMRSKSSFAGFCDRILPLPEKLDPRWWLRPERPWATGRERGRRTS